LTRRCSRHARSCAPSLASDYNDARPPLATRCEDDIRVRLTAIRQPGSGNAAMPMARCSPSSPAQQGTQTTGDELRTAKYLGQSQTPNLRVGPRHAGNSSGEQWSGMRKPHDPASTDPKAPAIPLKIQSNLTASLKETASIAEGNRDRGRGFRAMAQRGVFVESSNRLGCDVGSQGGAYAVGTVGNDKFLERPGGTRSRGGNPPRPPRDKEIRRRDAQRSVVVWLVDEKPTSPSKCPSQTSCLRSG